MKIFIVIPAFNEEKTIGCAINDLRMHGYENIVVVDDGSSDKTEKIAEDMDVIVVKHAINCGVGAATQTGIDHSLQSGAEIIVTFDGDCQHYASDIKNLIEPIVHGGYDIVIGSRFLKFQKIPWLRRLFNKIGNFLTYLISGIHSSDSQSGIKAFSREAAEKIRIHSVGYEYCSEIFREIKENRLAMIEIPVKVKYSNYSMLKGQNFSRGLETGFKLLVRSLMR
ncbi:glycosyltransferase family 2 protein [Candidatus Peregrinibacteria bacterium]|nr:glycosyltransferase family 2 protein [Candidatus Peregrinibacteria bacterium]